MELPAHGTACAWMSLQCMDVPALKMSAHGKSYSKIMRLVHGCMDVTAPGRRGGAGRMGFGLRENRQLPALINRLI